MRIKCFWLVETDRVVVWLRRYRSECPKDPQHTCEARLDVLANAPADEWGEWCPSEPDHLQWYWHAKQELIADNDPRWDDMRCERCGGAFAPKDSKQLWTERLFSGAPDGKLYARRDFPAGAMWDADWLPRHRPWVGEDGIALMVMLPNGREWLVDGPCSNCTRPKDRAHFCWVRHGDPRTGNVYVDKKGDSCAAGAGSIQAGDYHGYLRQGGYLDTK